VTTPDADRDEDVTGWADDVLVRLRIRGGRLTGWEQRRCARPDRGASCPETWEPFLRRNAELAARLARLPVS
jgi:excinuclease ABC subunit C